MKMNRRNVLVGIGAIVAGGGAALGTGAFSQVEATRTVSVETAGDADAFLALTAVDGAEDYVNEPEDGQIEIDIGGGEDGVNQNAVTTFNELVEITNNGTNQVTSIDLELEGDGAEVLTVVGDEGFDTLTMGAGDSVTFGLEIDLVEQGNDGDLPDPFDPTITITANTE
ncbi:hypothetical protein [Natronobeatus ordinarius]|uniref:hypothetical protein n=1 Tax=Natronobeatus ordinarius TaxID=2963433 RepID=UPI0020CD0A69|nr:hypothetical protein [Natronobeatus ordinarius]